MRMNRDIVRAGAAIIGTFVGWGLIRRIPASTVRKSEAILRKRGLFVDSHYYPEEDHFLLFSQRASVIRSIADWLKDEVTPAGLSSARRD